MMPNIDKKLSFTKSIGCGVKTPEPTNLQIAQLFRPCFFRFPPYHKTGQIRLQRRERLDTTRLGCNRTKLSTMQRTSRIHPMSQGQWTSFTTKSNSGTLTIQFFHMLLTTLCIWFGRMPRKWVLDALARWWEATTFHFFLPLLHHQWWFILVHTISTGCIC